MVYFKGENTMPFLGPMETAYRIWALVNYVNGELHIILTLRNEKTVEHSGLGLGLG